jgi:proton-dependent oligopeptide transporter, POT family
MSNLPPAGQSSTPPPEGPTFLGHPRGLALLFLVEMWERFSYYGMRAILGLYLVSPMSALMADGKPNTNPGRGWSEGDASNLAGWYTGLAYLLPIMGGLIADRLIGTHRSMVVGGLLIALGHIVLAVSGLGDMGHSDFGMTVFVGGLALIIIGTGHFKPSVSVMVGQLYKPGDPRRDGAFSIFYMGINLGAFICPYVCGTLGEKVGWHWGFGSAAVGMLAGLGIYLLFREKYLSGIGLPSHGTGSKAPLFFFNGVAIAALVAAAFHFGILKQIDTILSNRFVYGALAACGLAWMIYFVVRQKHEDRGPVASIFVFMLFNVLFWAGFEQASTSINFFTEAKTDRMVGSFEVPTSWFQSINPLGILLLAPVFVMLWQFLGKRRMNPSQPAKIGYGLILLAVGYICMTMAAMRAKTDPAKAGMFLVAATYIIHTLGELCLSPTGLSYVTKAAPRHAVSLLMGVWFLSSFVGNLAAGKLAALARPIERGEYKTPFGLGGQADFFVWFIIIPLIAGVAILAATPVLKKLLRNPTD